jgi:hypothetical protein
MTATAPILGRCAKPADAPQTIAWARRAHAPLAPLPTGSAYMNFLSAEGEARYRAAMGSKDERLRELKRRWDPTNVLRLNQNIVP